MGNARNLARTTAIVLAFAWPAVQAADAPPKFKITTKRDNDRVDVSLDNGTTILDVHSPTGISDVTIARTDAKWPEHVVLRLHLKGLEFFQAENGTDRLRASVSSTGSPQRISLWLNDKENAPLGAKSPFWTEIHVLGRDGKPVETLPGRGGYFEFRLPAGLFEKNPASITLHWIDFYRN
jgi:hypothetical protein